jgi:hypothetical protein
LLLRRGDFAGVFTVVFVFALGFAFAFGLGGAAFLFSRRLCGLRRRQSANTAIGSSTIPAAIAPLETRARYGSFAATTTSPSSNPAPKSSKAYRL